MKNNYMKMIIPPVDDMYRAKPNVPIYTTSQCPNIYTLKSPSKRM